MSDLVTEAVVSFLQLAVLYIRIELQYNGFNRVLKQVVEHPQWPALSYGIFGI